MKSDSESHIPNRSSIALEEPAPINYRLALMSSCDRDNGDGEDVLDIERMREFVELSRTMSFTEAARNLHMSQPNLSKHVRDMERELGATLVERGGVGSQSALTIAGVRFLSYARRAIADYDAIARECYRIEHADPPVRIQDVRHVVNVVPQLRLLLKEAGQEAANYTYVAVEGTAREALDGEIVDLAVVLEPFGRLEELEGEFPRDAYGVVALAPEPLFAMVGVTSPYFHRATITPSEVERSRVLRGDNAFFDRASRSIARIFAARGCDLTFSAHADHPLHGGAYPLEASDVNICTERFVQYYRDLDAEDFAVLQVEEFEPALYPFLVFRRNNANPAVRALARRVG